MEVRGEKNCIRVWMFTIFYLPLLFRQSHGRRTMLLEKDISNSKIKHLQILEVAKNLNMVMDVSLKDSDEPQPYVSSPLTLPPFDSLSPISLPDSTPLFCVYPPPQPSSTPSPNGLSPTPLLPPSSSPTEPILSPPIETTPLSPPSLGPIEPILSPPIGLSPTPILPPYLGPIEPILSPPTSIIPISPPYYEPSPPSGTYNPSPPDFTPGPPVFQPPVVFPGLSPPPASTGEGQIWCVAKPSVPDPILQEAMNYACGSGADCEAIQPNGECFEPNSAVAHSSYAFNSYWQRTKVAGGTCEFGGIAMLVTVNPGSEGCHFMGN